MSDDTSIAVPVGGGYFFTSDVDVDEPLAVDEAHAITAAIRTGIANLWELIKAAYRGHVWSVLGYDSWDEYCDGEFGTSRLRLPREERNEVVCSLRDAGMSLREIASATGLGKSTIGRELKLPVPNGTPLPPDQQASLREHLDSNREKVAVIIERENAERRGLRDHLSLVINPDGTDAKPKPKPREEFTATLDYRFGAIGDNINRLEQLIKSDRFRRYQPQIENAGKIPDIIRNLSARLAAIAEKVESGRDS